MKPKSLSDLLFEQRKRAYSASVRESQRKIIEVNAAARAAGMTYGKYVAALREEQIANDKRLRKQKKI